MINFNNTLTSKIISLIIAVSFLMTDISYAGASSQGSLRVPVGQRVTRYRMEKAMEGQQKGAKPPKSLREELAAAWLTASNPDPENVKKSKKASEYRDPAEQFSGVNGSCLI